jgi:MoaA/NifB/PqqE/SkfB family radical SAM enzyme
VLELTNRCSLACVHCSVSEAGHPHHETTGYLDPLLAEALLDDLVRTGARFDTLILFWLGEPLIHPHFSRIWRAALRASARHGTFDKVEVHTNATHLDARRTDAALNSADVRQVWHFSLDAIDQQTYLRVKGRDRFDLVQNNIADFLHKKARRRARWPRPVLQYIVSSNNVATVPAFRRHWEDVLSSAGLPFRVAAGHVPDGEDAVIFFRQLDCPTPELQQRENALFRQAMAEQGLSLPAQAAKGAAVAAENLSACSGFWKSPVISWQGEVTACTRDNHLDNSLGSLTEQSFSELWWGETMRGRREKVSCGDYDGLDLCATCFIPRSLNHAELSDDDIARTAAWEIA